MLVAVGNGPSFGGGLRICEGASMDDGLLDVVIINPVSKPKLLRVFPKLYRGTHVTHPGVRTAPRARGDALLARHRRVRRRRTARPAADDVDGAPGALRVLSSA